MRRSSAVFAVAVMACAGGMVRAHDGPRVWTGIVGGRIVTLASDDDFDPTRYHPSRVFSGVFEPFFGIFTTEFPGFEVPRDGSFGGAGLTNRTFGFDVLSPLLRFDVQQGRFRTVSEVYSPGVVPQLAFSAGAEVRITGDAEVSGFDFFTNTGIGDHAHLAFTLLGNGVTAGGGEDGVYGVRMRLRSPGLMDSLPFYLLLGKQVYEFEDEFVRARAEAFRLTQGPFVPEPAGLLGLGGVAFLIALRRRVRSDWQRAPASHRCGRGAAGGCGR